MLKINVFFNDFQTLADKKFKKPLFFDIFLLKMFKNHRYFDDFSGDDWRESRDTGAESVGYIGGRLYLSFVSVISVCLLERR